MKRSELYFTAALLPLDFLMIILAALTSYFLRLTDFMKDVRPVLFDLTFSKFLIITLVIAPIWLIIFALIGFYNIRRQKNLTSEFSRVFIGVSAGILLVLIFIFLRAELFSSRFLVISTWVIAIFYISLARFFLRLLQKFLYRYGVGVHRLVLIGETHAARHIENILSTMYSGFRVVATLPNLNGELMARLNNLLKNPGIDDILQTDPNTNREKLSEFINWSFKNKVEFKYVPDLFGTRAANLEMGAIADFPILELRQTSLDGWGRILKRAFDFCGALFLLVILSPLFIFVSLIVKLDSRGSVFIRLRRVGEHSDFYLYKFRSMITGAHQMKKELLQYSERRGPLFKMKEDPRVTSVGKFLRKTRIDELPQLINVLTGELSLVGPRPHEPEEVAQYETRHYKVLTIRPGVTGMAQIAGSAELDFEDEVRLDSFYIENWSLALDVQILFKTIGAVLKGAGAY